MPYYADCRNYDPAHRELLFKQLDEAQQVTWDAEGWFREEIRGQLYEFRNVYAMSVVEIRPDGSEGASFCYHPMSSRGGKDLHSATAESIVLAELMMMRISPTFFRKMSSVLIPDGGWEARLPVNYWLKQQKQ